MGWENFHSIWDEPADDDKKKSTGPRPNKESSWWAQQEESARGDEGDESIGRYSYRDAFDDTDAAWYRQSSFRYSGFSDYSPSSLFRSSFSSFRSVYYTETGGNEAKNKAIRALRTLTRNANTIANAAAKITYDVQFSAGADSNGMSAEISEKKAQTIYVSPDAVVESTTADDEDAAIDALTGFVLLRVQLSQDVERDVIREINKTSVRAMPMGLAEVIRNATDETDTKKVAADFVDAYSAGMLAKSMLTRLSRRAVVEDWGGFAPYFVRHAKKFASTKENLEKAELSTEALAAKIAYNMIDDENGIAVDKEVSDIAEKHLGAKLEHSQILPACIQLMADLRAYVASKSVTLPEDSLESVLAGGLQEIIDEQKEANAAAREKERTLRENMEGLADLFDGLYQPYDERAEAQLAVANMSKLANDVNALRCKEKLLQAAKTAHKTLEDAAEKYDTNPVLHSSNMLHARRTLEQAMRHFTSQLADLRAEGATQEIAGPQYNTTPPQVGAKAQAEDLAKFIEQVKPLLKNSVENIREQLSAAAAKFVEKMPEWEAKISAAANSAKELHEKMQKDTAKYPSLNVAAAVAETANQTLNAKLEQVKNAAADMAANFKCDSRAVRSVSSLNTALQHMQSWVNAQLGDIKATMEHFGWYHHRGGGAEFIAAANHAQSKADALKKITPDEPFNFKDWHDDAIENFIAESMADKANFKANTMAEANKEMFEMLRELLKNNNDGYVPSDTSDLKSDTLDKLSNAANSLGMSESELLTILRAIERDRESGLDASDAEALGQMLQDKLIDKAKELNPVDEQLFGETVEKRTTVLDDSALTHVNDEAKNAVEEEYVAYLSHNNAKPNVVVKAAKKAEVSRGRIIANSVAKRCRGAISRIREALQFQNNKRTGEVHGLLSGDLDEGSLHKLRYDSEHIWSQKTITRMPDVAVGILVDQSGSMSSSHKIDQAREMCILLAEAVKKIPGVHLHIYGHTANMHGTDLTLFEHYASNTSAENADLGSLGNIVAHCNNYDGYAIKETAKLLNQDPAKRKYLFVISDGLPHGAGYSGPDAKKHVASVCSFVRTRLKIPTYVFAVGASTSMHGEFEEQYGKSNVMFLSQVSQCLPQITRFLRNALQKEKSLVDASAD